jgi:hypothetical protein
MRYPAFFDAVPRIALRDPLAEFLGALEGGLVEFSYLDAVRLAGHSCPTVASAYGITRRALAALYGDALPERGALRVSFREPIGEGVTGVIANVISMLTGAAHDGGFKGIAGRFSRRDLLAFGAEQPLALRFARIDTGAAVDAEADIQRVPSDPQLPALLARAAEGRAGADELRRFGELWQDRVRRLLLAHGDDPEVFRIRPRA